MTFATKFQYTISMGKKFSTKTVPNILLLLSILLLIGTTNLFGSTTMREAVGFSLETSWYGSIPSEFHEDALPVRSHLSIGGTLTPFAIRFGKNTEISTGMSAFYTTRSALYGATIWRPFVAFGPELDFTYYLDEQFSITGGSAILLSFYTQTIEMTSLWRLFLRANYRLLPQAQRNHLFVSIPLSVDIRTDYVAVSTGIGFTYRFNRKASEVQP